MSVKRVKVVDQVYDQMLSKILEGSLKQGSRIDYSELENEFETSRVPIREAVQRLVSEGLLTMDPRGGTYVITLKSEDVRYLFQIRKFMEMEAVREGFDKIDRKKIRELKDIFLEESEAIDRNESFKPDSMIYDTDLELHRAIVIEASGNRIVDHIIGIIYNYAQLAQKMNVRTYSSNQEHLNIVNAILDDDRVGTLNALNHHLSQVEKSILKYIKSDTKEPE